jgi:hypothetical protein
LAGIDGEVDAVEQLAVAEGEGDVGNAKQGHDGVQSLGGSGARKSGILSGTAGDARA